MQFYKHQEWNCLITTVLIVGCAAIQIYYDAPKMKGVCQTVRLASYLGEESIIISSRDNCYFNAMRKNWPRDRQCTQLPRKTTRYW